MKDDPMPQSHVQVTHWIDQIPGAIPPENLDPRESARLISDAQAVAALLRQHVPTSVEPPYPGFFNAQILKRIRDEQATEALAPRASALWPLFLGWLRNPWVASGTTAVIAGVAALTWRIPNGGEVAGGTRVLSIFSPESQATVHIVPARDASAVIIEVDGLLPYPNDRTIVGLLNDAPSALLASHRP